MAKEFNKYKLPRNWIWVELGDILETTSGGTPSRSRPDFYNGTIPWVKSGELNYNIITKTEESITRAALESSSAKLFPKGTLLIALYGATVGRLAFLGIEASTNQAVCGIFQNSNINTKFIYYCLMTQYSFLISLSAGGAQPNISQTIIKKVNVPLPPLNEQNRIVDKLDELLSELEKGKEQLQTSLEQLKVYRQSILKYAFEGKIEFDRKFKNADWINTTLSGVCSEITDGSHFSPKSVSEG
jgi:type I restriction enzyme S subunit